MRRLCYLCVVMLAVASAARAQDHNSMDHASMRGAVDTVLPTMPGQDAYGAIAEVVRLLQADASTDWSKVNLEALRQHLIDMNAVTLRASVQQAPVPGGLQMLVTGDPQARDAIRRMTASHATALRAYALVAVSTPIDAGSRFTVTVADPTDTRLLAQVRGLGFAGLMTLGNHHATHHLALARGQAVPGHSMQ